MSKSLLVLLMDSKREVKRGLKIVKKASGIVRKIHTFCRCGATKDLLRRRLRPRYLTEASLRTNRQTVFESSARNYGVLTVFLVSISKTEAKPSSDSRTDEENREKRKKKTWKETHQKRERTPKQTFSAPLGHH